METIEKIYSCGRGDNDNAIAAVILACNNRKDEWKLKQEEKRLAEQYGMPYGEEVNDAQE